MISVEIHCVTAVAVFVSAFATLKSAKILCIFGECGTGFLYFCLQILRKFCAIAAKMWYNAVVSIGDFG